MKKQMKANLFAAIIGCCLFGAFLMSASGNSAAKHRQKATPPVAESAIHEMASVPFTFFYTLVTSFSNGGSINMDLGQAPIWDKPAGWGREQ